MQELFITIIAIVAIWLVVLGTGEWWMIVIGILASGFILIEFFR